MAIPGYYRIIRALRVWALGGAGAVLSTSVAIESAFAQAIFPVCRETCPDPFRDPVGARPPARRESPPATENSRPTALT
jgi:hypothetical protein